MVAPDELNERQQALIAQVRQGEIQEDEPDTEASLLTLARLGHLNVEHDADGYHFTVADDGEPSGEPEQTDTSEPVDAPSQPQPIEPEQTQPTPEG